MFIYSIALLLCASFFAPPLYADTTDFLRDRERREDYSKGTRQSGLFEEEYTTKSGEKRTRFSLFPGARGDSDETARSRRRRAARERLDY
jgi:hypothetical protein